MKKAPILFFLLLLSVSVLSQNKDYTEIKFKSKLRNYTKTMPKTKVYGIEKDEFTVPLAVRFFGEDKIEQADIRTYPNYDRFDVIYYFCPLPNHDPQKKLERYIEDRMKVGAILIANRKKSMDIDEDSRFKRLSDILPIWKKVSV